jgi:molybdopterin molybdotransferase
MEFAMNIISQKEALDLLLAEAGCLDETETIATEHALGRVLAKSLVSPMDVPQFDNSAMDGFAISTKEGNSLSIAQRIPAGAVPSPLETGTAARIFTGAQIPQGADSVVMQEKCSYDDSIVKIENMPRPGANIRRRGEDISAGRVFLEKGVKLRPQELGIAASVGFASLEVYRKLKVAVFFTGDELVMPGNPLGAGQIYNSNRYSLIGFLNALNCEVFDLGIVRDDFDATVAALDEARMHADLVMTCGGVSVGEEDHVKAAVEKIGKLSFWKVAVKPGKPFSFGDLAGIPFIGLPGNPVSAFLSFCLFARPFILKKQGMRDVHPLALKTVADFEWTGGMRTEWLRSRFADGMATIHPDQGSASISPLSWADGLVEIQAGMNVSRGDPINFFPFSSFFS